MENNLSFPSLVLSIHGVIQMKLSMCSGCMVVHERAAVMVATNAVADLYPMSLHFSPFLRHGREWALFPRCSDLL